MKKRKLKVGDRVKYINKEGFNSKYFSEGEILTIKKINDTDRLFFDEVVYVCREREVKLLKNKIKKL